MVLRPSSCPRFLSAPRKLAKLGISISQAAVSKYMIRRRKPPSQTWRSFLDNHVEDLVSIDFFTLPTATFRILFVFIILRHDRRRIVHFNVTEHPSAEWTAQQIVDAFPWDTAPRYLLREPGWNLRAVLQTARCGTRHRAGSDGAALPVAEPLRRTGHWKHSARVSRSRDHPRRATPQANPARIRRLLSFLPDSFIARERCPRATTCAVAFDGARDSHSEGRRPPSLLQSSRCLSSLRLTRCPWDTSRGVLGRASIPRSP